MAVLVCCITVSQYQREKDKDTERETERETERKRDGDREKTDKQTETEKEKDSERQTERQKERQHSHEAVLSRFQVIATSQLIVSDSTLFLMQAWGWGMGSGLPLHEREGQLVMLVKRGFQTLRLDPASLFDKAHNTNSPPPRNHDNLSLSLSLNSPVNLLFH